LSTPLHDAVREFNLAVGAIRDHSHHAGEDLTAEIVQTRTLIKSAVSDFERNTGELMAAIKLAETDIEQFISSVDVDHFSDQVHDQIDHHFSDLDHQVETAAQSLSGTLEHLEADALHEVNSLGQQLLDTANRHVIGSIEAIEHSVSEALTSYQHALAETISGTLHDVENGVRQRCASAVDEVIQAVVQRLLSQLEETVIVTELGAQITGFIGPYLPEIILISKLLDLIEEELRALRSL
jgi:hypothetical protein